MDIRVGIIAWASYWLSYVIFQGLLPADRIDPDRRWRIALVVFRNCITTFILSCAWSKLFENMHVISTPWWFAWPVSYFIMDVVFYVFHRALHHPRIYSWHKQHHSVNFAYPASALYCSNLEAAADLISHTIGPMIFGFGHVEICIWSAMIALHSLVLHSHIEPRYHITHHIRQNCNYGITKFPDYICGTVYKPLKISADRTNECYGLAEIIDIARASDI